MKLRSLIAIVAGIAATTVCAAFAGSLFHNAPPVQITGDYVEARTASVFCGACHYNGELVSTGQDALLAWKFDGGVYHGVSLAGLRAMAAVTSDRNLGYDDPRRTQLAVDACASDAQTAALAALLEEKCGNQLGQIVNVRRVAISFAHNDSGYLVSAPGFGTLNVSYRTDNACCVQPGLVWFDPLSPIDHRKVGFTETAKFTGSANNPWERSGEDSAFYGAMAF